MASRAGPGPPAPAPAQTLLLLTCRPNPQLILEFRASDSRSRKRLWWGHLRIFPRERAQVFWQGDCTQAQRLLPRPSHGGLEPRVRRAGPLSPLSRPPLIPQMEELKRRSVISLPFSFSLCLSIPHLCTPYFHVVGQRPRAGWDNLAL